MGTGESRPASNHCGRTSCPTGSLDAKLGIFVHWTAPTIAAFAPITDSPFELAAAHGWEHALAQHAVRRVVSELAVDPGLARWRVHHEANWRGVPYEELVARFVEAAERWDPALWADAFVPRRGALRRLRHQASRRRDALAEPPRQSAPPGRWSLARDFVGELDPRRARPRHALWRCTTRAASTGRSMGCRSTVSPPRC